MCWSGSLLLGVLATSETAAAAAAQSLLNQMRFGGLVAAKEQCLYVFVKSMCVRSMYKPVLCFPALCDLYTSCFSMCDSTVTSVVIAFLSAFVGD